MGKNGKKKHSHGHNGFHFVPLTSLSPLCDRNVEIKAKLFDVVIAYDHSPWLTSSSTSHISPFPSFFPLLPTPSSLPSHHSARLPESLGISQGDFREEWRHVCLSLRVTGTTVSHNLQLIICEECVRHDSTQILLT